MRKIIPPGNGFVVALHAVVLISFALSITYRGVPALRQDWWWPTTHQGVVDYFSRSISGWLPIGIGQPNAYPNDYLLAAALFPAMQLLGPLLALFLFAATIGCCFHWVAVLCSRSVEKTRWYVPLVAEVILLFNPWTYTEVVAGHLYMLLGLTGLAITILAVASSSNSPRSLIVGVALALSQMQFFIICVFIVATLAIYRKSARLPFLISLVLAGPIVVGVLYNRRELMSIPFLAIWERSESLNPSAAFAFMGYHPNYVAHVDALFRFGGMLVVFAGVCSVVLCRSFKTVVPALIGVFVIVLSIGFRGPLAGLEWDLMDKIKALAVFRELYDLIGIAIVLFVIASVRGSSRTAVRITLIVASLIYVTGWLVSPPARWWLSAERIPVGQVRQLPMSRFALSPAFAPISFRDQGSGLDPRAFDRKRSTVFNQYIALFPEGTALERFQADGDTAMLRNLGVSLILEDRRFASVGNALGQGAYCPAHTRAIAIKDATPLISLQRFPKISFSGARVGANQVFVSDVPAWFPGNKPRAWFATSRVLRDSFQDVPNGVGWVDAQFVFNRRPALGQPFGGVGAIGISGVLVVQNNYILAAVDGLLVSGSGRIIARGKNDQYRWIDLHGRRSIKCLGTCVVAMESATKPQREQGVEPQSTIDDHYPVRTIRFVFPWLAIGRAFVSSRPVLVFDARFNKGWALWTSRGRARHFMLDHLINAWYLGSTKGSIRLVLIDRTALAQFVLEVIALLSLVIGLSLVGNSKKFSST